MDEQACAAFTGKVDKLRAHWLISPIDYGCVLAFVKGVPIYYADATSEETNQWFKKIEASIEKSPRIVQPILYACRARGEQNFRDTRTLVDLVAIAENMQPTGPEKPVLAYAGGKAHRKNIEQLLDGQDVAYVSGEFSPERPARNTIDTIRDVGHLVVPLVDSSNQRYQKLWVANAEKNTT